MNATGELPSIGKVVQPGAEKPRPSFKYFAATSIGPEGVRETNEDTFLTPHGSTLEVRDDAVKFFGGKPFLRDILQISPPDIENLPGKIQTAIDAGKLMGLSIVADGMGGHNDGKLASSVASIACANYIMNRLSEDPERDTPKLLKSAIRYADQVLESFSMKYGSMGTTLSLVFTDKSGETYVCYTGDTRVYLQDEKDMLLVTQDQSEAWKVYVDGGYPPSEIFRNHRMASSLLHAVSDGTLKPEDVMLNKIDFKPGQRLIMCTDGVWGRVSISISGDLLDHIDTKTVLKSREPGIDKTLENQKAFGKMFKQINLFQFDLNSSSQSLTQHLVRDDEAALSQDNATVVIVEFPKK